MARNPKRLGAGATAVVVLLILAMIAASCYVVWLCVDLVNLSTDQSEQGGASVTLPTSAVEVTEPATEETVPPTTTEPPVPEQVVATATISTDQRIAISWLASVLRTVSTSLVQR